MINVGSRIAIFACGGAIIALGTILALRDGKRRIVPRATQDEEATWAMSGAMRPFGPASGLGF